MVSEGGKVIFRCWLTAKESSDLEDGSHVCGMF
jgi:hypothetical protein